MSEFRNAQLTGSADGVPARNLAADLALARAERDKGFARAEGAWDADVDRLLIDWAIDRLAASGRWFSSNDVRAMLPPVRGSLVGTRFMSAAKRKEIERGDTEQAVHRAGHCRRVSLWRGTGH